MNTGKDHWFIKNIIKAALLILAIVLVAQIFLKAFTRHNLEISVPDFTTLPLAEAGQVAKAHDIRIEVTDSVYNKRIGLGTVYSQNPAAGRKVKKGRRVMITINAMQAKTVEMPRLVGFSLRQAATELASRGLTVGRLSYVTDIATNNVLEQKYKGRKIAAGSQVENESAIDLVLGLNPSDNTTYVPDLRGMSLKVAKENLIDNSLNLGRVSFDETVSDYADTLNAIVYTQSPAFNQEADVPIGTSVNISLTTSMVKAATAQ